MGAPIPTTGHKAPRLRQSTPGAAAALGSPKHAPAAAAGFPALAGAGPPAASLSPIARLTPGPRTTPGGTAPPALALAPLGLQPGLLPASQVASRRQSPAVSEQAEADAAAARRRAERLQAQLKKAQADADAAAARAAEARKAEAAAAAALVASQGERSSKESAELAALRQQLEEERLAHGARKDALDAARLNIAALKALDGGHVATAVQQCHDMLLDYRSTGSVELPAAELQNLQAANSALARVYSDMRRRWGTNPDCKHVFDVHLGSTRVVGGRGALMHFSRQGGERAG